MTTVIIDRKRGVVLSDSRGTEEKTQTEISWLPYPKRKVKDSYVVYDNIQKVFRVGKTVITGTGALTLLEEIVQRFKLYQYYTPKTLWVKSEFDLSDTLIFINKVFDGKMKTLRLELSAKRFLGEWQRVSVIKSYPATDYTFAGSGHQYATGAMEAGATPERALEVAKTCDQYSGGATQREVLL